MSEGKVWRTAVLALLRKIERNTGELVRIFTEANRVVNEAQEEAGQDPSMREPPKIYKKTRKELESYG